MQSKLIKRTLFLLASIVIAAALAWYFHAGAPSRSEAGPLIIAYGDDLGGILLQKALAGIPTREADGGLDSINLGDCCGSNAQFALSTGKVDVAVLCPDAVTDLEENGKKYTVIGTLVYDGNVLVTRPDSPEVLRVIGYMNGRGEQYDLLRQTYGENADLQPMFAAALPYALENKAVDAIMLDVSLALKLGYPMRSLSERMATSVVIVANRILEDPRVERMKAACNEAVASLSDEDILTEMLCSYLETENKEEVSSLWKTVIVQFGSL